MTGTTTTVSRAGEWKHVLLIVVAGLLLFETLTGLLIWLLPFSVTNQINVIMHTLIGLVFLVPFAWYQMRHWLIYRQTKLNHYKLTGYFSLAATLLAIVSGLVLTYQATFATRISYAWDLIHIVSTFALIASVVPHLVTIVARNLKGRQLETINVRKSEKRFAWGSALVTGSLFAVVALAVYAYEPVVFNNEFPADYETPWGEDRPFAPSLAQTSTGGAFDSRSLGGSESCGSSGCHEEILKEWQVSAHRYSAMDVAFQKVQSIMGEQNGPESTRYCGGCHDPISLFSGTKNIFTEELTNLTGYDEGVSCIACHAIKETDVKGNAAYTMTQPDRYMFELSEGSAAKRVSDFLIKAYPRHHVETLQHRLFKSPEFCAACHKQFIDEEINNVGWVQLQNQYDNWRESRWNHPGDAAQTIECRECHMPLTESLDPASGDPIDYNRSPGDKKHRSHRFLAANQFMPLVLDLPGAQEHVELTEKWLRGEIEIPEISHKWQLGPAVPIELVMPDTAAPGERITIQAVITNNKPGHDFPTGPIDIIQSWVEIAVTDQSGNVVYESGTRDDRHYIEPGSFVFKVEPVDQYDNLIDRHNLWELVGVRYRRSLFPGMQDRAEFTFSVPASVTGDLEVNAKLLYRKVNQNLLDILFGEESGVTAPISLLSVSTGSINLSPMGTR
ncbi:MAG: hypothetical protein JSW51_14520 [Gemmatimonadota bacterium]|nr:MAG: hypothetical protein JSW51_14520 [Gemmatimonadota bacterium]